MKESYRKGVANYPDPESCRCRVRKAGREALTGAQAGQETELRNHRIQEADAVDGSGRRKTGERYRELAGVPAQSSDPEHVWNFYAREPGGPTHG